MWSELVAKKFKNDCLGGDITDVREWHRREVVSTEYTRDPDGACVIP